MATDATGTPTSLGIPRFDVANDAPSGLGFNAAMSEIDTLLSDRIVDPGGNENDVLTKIGGAWAAQPPSGGGAASVTPVTLTNPQVSANGGNSFFTVLGMTDWDAGHWEFLKDVDGKVYGNVLIPANVTAATLRLVIAANATSGITRINIATASVASGASFNPGALTDATAQDITVPATAYFRKDVTFALSGLTGGNLLILEILHNGAHANDTLAASTLLLGAWLEPTA